MALTVAQAEQVAQVIWKRAPGIPDRAKTGESLERPDLPGSIFEFVDLRADRGIVVAGTLKCRFKI
jgi:hypothetical protein